MAAGLLCADLFYTLKPVIMLKKIYKGSLYLTILFLILIAGFCTLNYHADIPYEKLKATYSYPDSRHVEIMGMPVHYRIHGTGQPIVLFHGTGASLHAWEELIAEIKTEYQTISLDLPAFGLTGPHADNDYSLLFYMTFLDAFFKELKLDSFHLAGNSFGGQLAWAYALHQPEKVNKLVLFDASGYPYAKDEPLPLGFRLASNPFTARLLEKITPKSIVRKTALAAYADPTDVTPEKENRYFEMLLRPGNRKALNGRMVGVKNEESHRIKNITQPTLIIWGELDKLVPVKNAHRFKKDIPNSELIVYENIGHVPMEEIPGRVGEDLKRFLVGTALASE